MIFFFIFVLFDCTLNHYVIIKQIFAISSQSVREIWTLIRDMAFWGLGPQGWERLSSANPSPKPFLPSLLRPLAPSREQGQSQCMQPPCPSWLDESRQPTTALPRKTIDWADCTFIKITSAVMVDGGLLNARALPHQPVRGILCEFNES